MVDQYIFCLKMIQLLIFLLLPALLSGMCQHGSCLNPNAPRIAGGDPSSRNSRPFQVALYTEVSETETTGFCGGSLIHQEWVLTAAHCCFLNGQEVDNIQAIIGAHSLYDRYENGRRFSRVITIEVHPDYDEFYFSNDVALLRLANVMQITDVVDTIRLPYLHMLNDNFAGMTATVSGWGIPADGVTFVSPTLREKLMPVVSDSYCNQTYMFQLRGSVVCGFSTQSGTCKGDNGGPMTIFYNSTEEHILIGVASFVSAGGCNIELPSVFTRVQPYLDWISNVTGIGLYP